MASFTNNRVPDYQSGRELWVGANEQYTTLRAAVNDALDGDTVFIRAGVYENDFATIRNDISIIGVGGKAHLKSTQQIPNGKAILVTDANTVIENVEFSGAFVADRNGAGIRQQLGNLTIRNSYFHDNEMGILSASNPTAVTRIENTVFDRNGNGTNFSHQVYVNTLASLEVTNSTFTESRDVTDIQSRALSTTVTDSVFDDTDGTSSYLINLPNAGDGIITGNTLIYGANAGNFKPINYGTSSQLHPGSLLVANNTLTNNLESSLNVVGVRNASNQEVVIADNLFIGFDGIVTGTATLSGNTMQDPLNTTEILGTAGNDNLAGTAINEMMDGLDGNDTMNGLAGNDYLIGGAGNDTLFGGDGADALLGGGGNDRLYADALDTQVNGGAGFDRLYVQGTEGMTVDLAAAEIEYAVGNDGADVFDASNAAAKVTAFGKDGADALTGGAGGDVLKGDTGNDQLIGNAGSDRLYGGAGADILIGGDGNDRLYADALDIQISGGAGFDRLLVRGAAGITMDLAASSIELAVGNNGADTFDGSGATSRIIASGKNGADTLIGGAAGDILKGNAGDDQLIGNAGDDRLYGGGGADTLNGGAGNNSLFGGRDDDVFLTQDTGFGRLFGGTGFDTLRFEGADRSFDLSALSAGRINSLEALDITGTGDNTLIIDTATVLTATQGVNGETGAANSLIIDGNAGDTVNADTGWTDAGTATIDGQGYSVYESAASDASLYVDSNVEVNVG